MSELRAALIVALRSGYTLEVAAEMEGIDAAGSRLDRDALELLFHRVLHAHGLDSKRRLSPRLEASGQWAEELTPWFFLVRSDDLENASKITSSLIHTEPRSILADSLRLFSLQCLQAHAAGTPWPFTAVSIYLRRRVLRASKLYSELR